MNDPFPSEPPRAERASSSEVSTEALLATAERALKDRVWEAAIQSFQSVLKHHSDNAAAHFGVARAYEGKSRDDDSRPFLLLALEHYRSAARLNSSSQEAHDALLAASVAAGQTEELLTQYKTLAAREPGNPLHAATLKKIETLLLLRSETSRPPAPARPLVGFLFGIVAPFAGLFSIVAGFAVQWQQSFPVLRPLGPALLRTGALAFLAYFIYRLVARR
jgi:tetratricopeptide (TPR) repeat protein